MALLSQCSIRDFKARRDGLDKEYLQNKFPSSIVQAVINIFQDHRNGEIELDSIRMGFVEHETFHAVEFIVNENQTSKRNRMLLIETRLNELEDDYSGQSSGINIHDDKGENSIKYMSRGNRHVVAHNRLYKDS